MTHVGRGGGDEPVVRLDARVQSLQQLRRVGVYEAEAHAGEGDGVHQGDGRLEAQCQGSQESKGVGRISTQPRTSACCSDIRAEVRDCSSHSLGRAWESISKLAAWRCSRSTAWVCASSPRGLVRMEVVNQAAVFVQSRSEKPAGWPNSSRVMLEPQRASIPAPAPSLPHTQVTAPPRPSTAPIRSLEAVTRSSAAVRTRLLQLIAE